ncbi:hypothetical protein C2G38_2272749 [Gigaspora rosea]|uniref:Uncharacterized protein n=1 Tax=Gigaspora rosea TaxID=44941 RepID=A0A397UCJ5_9GLOM|nr:hypothetical protein C2G38_2272749 [Gigaspora rosea]
MKVNEFLRKDSKGERQNEENYCLNDLGRPNSIAIQADIVKRCTKIEFTEKVLDVGTTSRIKNLEYCHPREIEVEKDKHEASKDYEKPTEPIFDKKAEGPEYCDEVGIGFKTDELKALLCYQESADMGDNDEITNLKQCIKKESEVCDENDDQRASALEDLRRAREYWMKKAIKFKRIICKKIETLRYLPIRWSCTRTFDPGGKPMPEEGLDNLDQKNMTDINDPKDQNDSYHKTDKRDNNDNNDNNNIKNPGM